MADTAKITLKRGDLEFSGEGDQVWLEKQLDKFLQSDAPKSRSNNTAAPTGSTNVTLASFLDEKNAKANQNRKFLATAQYLHMKGQKQLKPGDVAKALISSSQKRLANPSDTLKQNIGKGFCDRDGEFFFVTDEGRKELGL